MGTVVLKCGGSVADELGAGFFQSIKELLSSGFKVLLVHGGGPDITSYLKEKGIETKFVDGLRYTDDEVLSAVEVMLAGKTNRQIVKLLKANGIPAIGIQGPDSCFRAELIDRDRYGLVGAMTGAETGVLLHLLDLGLVPVVTPLAEGPTGEHLNVNADSAAAYAAIALKADELLFVTNVKGIMKDGVVLESTTKSDIDSMIEDGTIYGGMIPKVKGALNALESGIGAVRIVSGQDAVWSSGSFSGTAIKKEEK